MPRNKRRLRLTDEMKQAIQLMVLDRWKTSSITKHVCNTIGVDATTLGHWRRSTLFRDEFERQLTLFRANFGDIQMADRKERVMALDKLYNQIPDRQVSLKVKVLAAIRAEVGDDKVIQHKHEVVQPQQGPVVPPRANDYEEWLRQNRKAQAVEAEHEVISSNGTSEKESRPEEVEESGEGEDEIDSFSDPLFFLNSSGGGGVGGDESGGLRLPEGSDSREVN